MCEEPQTERLHVESRKGIPQGEPNGHKDVVWALVVLTCRTKSSEVAEKLQN